ncbi:MAG TPA: FAD-dependent monooxygenase [Burkholderiales bacterium]|nr:FAD-dependent monooxygenase [Burkholderiales bacterium]HRG61669.1 FAD-dependent monooxygenase [Burkholderiales bacterium]
MKKILVVGAGVAGLTVCYWLKKFGFLPVLIEKSDFLRTGGHAVDIRSPAVDIIKKMDIYESIFEMRTQLENSYHVGADNKIIKESHGEESGFNHGDDVEIVRGDLLWILMDSIKDIPCHFGQTITQIKQHEKYVEITLKSGKTEYYDLVIGADGLYSSTREMAFTTEQFASVDLNTYIGVFSIPNYLNLSRSEIDFESDNKLISVTSFNDRYIDKAIVAFSFSCDEKMNDVRDQMEQKTLLRSKFMNMGWEVNNLLKLMDDSDDFYFDSAKQIHMTSWTEGRVALIGDAGYCAAPLAGQGTSQAIIGAYLLAVELKRLGGNHSIAFDHYNKLLRPYVEANHDLALWVSEMYFLLDEVSDTEIELRNDMIKEKLQIASNAIKLPE